MQTSDSEVQALGSEPAVICRHLDHARPTVGSVNVNFQSTSYVIAALLAAW